MSKEEHFRRFLLNYKLHFYLDTGLITHKTKMWDKTTPKQCRFCERHENATSFRGDSHTIPKFLGSRYLLSAFECDKCNDQFKVYDNNFANFIGAIRSVIGITGKSKNPKTNRKELQIFQEEDDAVRVVGKKQFQQIERGERSIVIDTIKDPFTPSMVYKALLKIALSFIPIAEVENYRRGYNYLLGKEGIGEYKGAMNIMRVYIPGPAVPAYPVVEQFKRKNTQASLPDRIMVLHLKNMKFQLNLPFSSNDDHLKGRSVDVPMRPVQVRGQWLEKFGDMQHESIELASDEQITNQSDGFTLKISNVKKISS